MITEIWKDIKGYENKYQVSEFGNVRTKEDKKILKQYTVRKYKYVSLYLNGKSKLVRVHRLVAKAFDNNFTDNCVVMHKDNDTTNNYIDNLKCGTQKENIEQCVNERRIVTYGHKIKRINQYDLEDNLITIFDSYKECAKYFNTSIECIHSHISRSKKGQVDKKRCDNGWCRLFKVEE